MISPVSLVTKDWPAATPGLAPELGEPLEPAAVEPAVEPVVESLPPPPPQPATSAMQDEQAAKNRAFLKPKNFESALLILFMMGLLASGHRYVYPRTIPGISGPDCRNGGIPNIG
ncbi:hypothetical protein PSAC2689_140083 [Paraburkholderia sacchari]